MIRVIIYLIILAALAFGAVWMADRPGEVAITWQGRRIDTSVMVLLAAVAALIVACVIAWSILRAIMRAPETIARYRRYRRGVRGYRAVSQGLIAVGSGNARTAKKFTAEAVRIAPREPLTLLLSAQSAQLNGDRDGAVATFQQMAERDDTRVLGLHGLFVEAQRRQDHAAALGFAEEASRDASMPVWAAQAVLEFRCAAGDWSGALERLERNMRSGLIDKRTYRRQRAVLFTAQAQSLADSGDRARAIALAREAAKLAPDLVPAAALAGRLLGEAGERRRAARTIERAWRANPHPDLAAAYSGLRPGDSARQRLSRVETLAAKGPADAEAALAVARAALDAQEFAAARKALAPYTASPRKRVAALMAELEMAQGDEGRAREWMARALNARRDPAWTADAFVSDHWLPISPVSGRLDAFEWKDPLAGEDHGTVIEHRAEAPVPPPATPAVVSAKDVDAKPVDAKPSATGQSATGEGPPSAESSQPAPLPPSQESEEKEKAQRAAEEAAHADPFSAGGRSARRAMAAATAAESRAPRGREMPAVAPAVIPLVHAPDDPGPNGETEVEPAPEPAPPPADGWSRIRALFRP